MATRGEVRRVSCPYGVEPLVVVVCSWGDEDDGTPMAQVALATWEDDCGIENDLLVDDLMGVPHVVCHRIRAVVPCAVLSDEVVDTVDLDSLPRPGWLDVWRPDDLREVTQRELREDLARVLFLAGVLL